MVAVFDVHTVISFGGPEPSSVKAIMHPTIGMKPKTWKMVTLVGVASLFVALFLPFSGGLAWGWYGQVTSGFIGLAGFPVQIAALLLYGGAFLVPFTGRFQTLVLVGGVSFLLLALEFDAKVANVNFQVGILVIIAGIVMTTSDLWRRTIIEPLMEEEEIDTEIEQTDEVS